MAIGALGVVQTCLSDPARQEAPRPGWLLNQPGWDLSIPGTGALIRSISPTDGPRRWGPDHSASDVARPDERQEPPPALFLVVLGGRSEGCLIEQHDVRLVVGSSLEATIPELRRQWRGRRQGLHIDSWVRLERLEGFRLRWRPEPSAGPERLWFVNIGGYDPGQLSEQHAFGLFVARSAQAARAKALRTLLPAAVQRHKDDLHAVDDCLAVGQLQGWWVHLDRQAGEQPRPPEPLRPDWFGYRRIDGRGDAAAAGIG